MRYFSYYQEYPIYEPAEGGYYYTGNRLISTERLSKRQCKKKLEQIWKECNEENKKNGFLDPDDPNYTDWCQVRKITGIYPWYRSVNEIYQYGIYIGEGKSIVIERHKGSQERRYEPYC